MSTLAKEQRSLSSNNLAISNSDQQYMEDYIKIQQALLQGQRVTLDKLAKSYQNISPSRSIQSCNQIPTNALTEHLKYSPRNDRFLWQTSPNKPSFFPQRKKSPINQIHKSTEGQWQKLMDRGDSPTKPSGRRHSPHVQQSNSQRVLNTALVETPKFTPSIRTFDVLKLTNLNLEQLLQEGHTRTVQKKYSENLQQYYDFISQNQPSQQNMNMIFPIPEQRVYREIPRYKKSPLKMQRDLGSDIFFKHPSSNQQQHHFTNQFLQNRQKSPQLAATPQNNPITWGNNYTYKSPTPSRSPSPYQSINPNNFYFGEGEVKKNINKKAQVLHPAASQTLNGDQFWRSLSQTQTQNTNSTNSHLSHDDKYFVPIKVGEPVRPKQSPSPNKFERNHADKGLGGGRGDQEDREKQNSKSPHRKSMNRDMERRMFDGDQNLWKNYNTNTTSSINEYQIRNQNVSQEFITTQQMYNTVSETKNNYKSTTSPYRKIIEQISEPPERLMTQPTAGYNSQRQLINTPQSLHFNQNEKSKSPISTSRNNYNENMQNFQLY